MMYNVKIEGPFGDITENRYVTDISLVKILRALHTFISEGWEPQEIMRSITIDGYHHNFMTMDPEELEEYIYNMIETYMDTGIGCYKPQ